MTNIFLFNGKVGIEISWARNSHTFFSWQKICEQQSRASSILSIMANSAKKIPGEGQKTIFFQSIFYKQNPRSRVVKAHFFYWQKKHPKHNHILDVKKMRSRTTFVLPFGKFFRKIPGHKLQSIFFSMANFVSNNLGQRPLLFYGKFWEKLVAGPGISKAYFANRVREISRGRDFKGLIFFSLGKVGAGISKNCWARGGPFKG